MNANQNDQNNDAAISDADLDKVAGGFFSYFLPRGAMNDAAQQFQQILQQLTQG